MATGFFVDVSVISALTNIANLGVNAAGAIIGVDIAKEQFKLKKDIAEIQLDIERKIADRQLEILDLRIESAETQIEIDNHVQESVKEAFKEQEKSVAKEEELKQLLLSIELQKLLKLKGGDVEKQDLIIEGDIIEDVAVISANMDASRIKDFSSVGALQNGVVVFPEGAENFEVLFRLGLVEPNLLGNASVSIAGEFIRVSADNDIVLGISDGVNFSGVMRVDNLPGAFFNFSGVDSGNKISSVVQGKRGDAPVSNSFTANFEIKDNVVISATMSGVTVVFESLANLDVKRGLFLLLVRQTSNESWGVENLSIEVSTQIERVQEAVEEKIQEIESVTPLTPQEKEAVKEEIINLNFEPKTSETKDFPVVPVALAVGLGYLFMRSK